MDFHYSDKVLGMRPSIIRELLKQMSDPSLISFAGGNPAADSFPVADIRAFSDKLLEPSRSPNSSTASQTSRTPPATPPAPQSARPSMSWR